MALTGGWLGLIIFDGLVQGVDRKAGCGGLIRNRHASWVCGFAKNINTTTAFLEEL